MSLVKGRGKQSNVLYITVRGKAFLDLVYTIGSKGTYRHLLNNILIIYFKHNDLPVLS